MICWFAFALFFGQAAGPLVQDEPLRVPAVVYPAEAKAARIEGTVRLQVNVDATGHVTSVRALDGPIALRQAAADAYLQATYPPLVTNGRPGPAIVTTAVKFALTELPPDTDLLVDRQFAPLHAACQEMSLEHAADALGTCRRAVEMERRFSAGAELEARVTALNDLVLLLIAPGKYDPAPGPKGKPTGKPNPDLPEAAVLAGEAVELIGGNGPHKPAVALAYITRAEVRSLQGDLRGAGEDCGEAEEALKTLLHDAPETQRAGNYRVQLRDTYLLHAVVEERAHRGAEAKRLKVLAGEL